MGALFGSILQEGGLPVTMIDTDAEHVAAMRKDGLRISGFGGERKLPVEVLEDASGIDHADIILFQCKSHGTRLGAEGVRHLVKNGAICVSFQNGLGNEEAIGEVVGPENVPRRADGHGRGHGGTWSYPRFQPGAFAYRRNRRRQERESGKHRAGFDRGRPGDPRVGRRDP